MADFDEGLAIGFLLGKKKGGGGIVYRNDIFEDMVNNTTYLSEYKLSDTYTFKFGAWVSDVDGGRFLGNVNGNGYGYYNMSELVNPDDMSGDVRHGQIPYYEKTPDVVPSAFVFKNGSPLYAVPSIGEPISFKRNEWIMNVRKNPTDTNPSTMIHFPHYSGHKIESVNGGFGWSITHGSDNTDLNIGGGGMLVVTYSYNVYGYPDDTVSLEPPLTGHETETVNRSVSSSVLSIIPSSQSIVMTNLNVSGLIYEIKCIWRDAYEKEGIAAYVPERIIPSDN